VLQKKNPHQLRNSTAKEKERAPRRTSKPAIFEARVFNSENPPTKEKKTSPNSKDGTRSPPPNLFQYVRGTIPGKKRTAIAQQATCDTGKANSRPMEKRRRERSRIPAFKPRFHFPKGGWGRRRKRTLFLPLFKVSSPGWNRSCRRETNRPQSSKLLSTLCEEKDAFKALELSREG